MQSPKQSNHLQIDNTQTHQTSRHRAYAYFITILILFTIAIYGFAFTLISASSLPMLIHYYSITFSNQVILSLLNGILPIGAIFGSIITPYFLSISVRKKNLFYLINLMTISSCAITIIPTFAALMIGRFFIGICCGLYSSVSSSLIKEMFTVPLRKQISAISACMKIIGVLVCYLIAFGFNYTEDEIQHIIVFMGPAYLAFIHTILAYFLLPQNPLEQLSLGYQQKVKDLLNYLYENNFIEVRYHQLQTILMQKKSIKTRTSFGNRSNLSFIHLTLLKSFCGVNFMIVYAGQIMRELTSNLANVTPVIFNSALLFCGFWGILIVKKFRRKQLIILGCIFLCVINLIIGFADLLQNPSFLLSAMMIFTIPSATCLTSIDWWSKYQFSNPEIGKYSSLVNWTAITMVTLIPPYITKQIKGNNAFPIFFFFAVYLFAASIINFFLVDPEHQQFSQIYEPMNDMDATIQ